MEANIWGQLLENSWVNYTYLGGKLISEKDNYFHPNQITLVCNNINKLHILDSYYFEQYISLVN